MLLFIFSFYFSNHKHFNYAIAMPVFKHLIMFSGTKDSKLHNGIAQCAAFTLLLGFAIQNCFVSYSL